GTGVPLTHTHVERLVLGDARDRNGDRVPVRVCHAHDGYVHELVVRRPEHSGAGGCGAAIRREIPRDGCGGGRLRGRCGGRRRGGRRLSGRRGSGRRGRGRGVGGGGGWGGGRGGGSG